MSQLLLQILIYPEPGRKEEEALGAAHMPAGRAELTVITFDPGLTETEGFRAQQGYRVMLPGNMLVRFSEYFFHAFCSGSCHRPGIKVVKNRVADHQGIRY